MRPPTAVSHTAALAWAKCLVEAPPLGRCLWGLARWRRMTSPSRFPPAEAALWDTDKAGAPAEQGRGRRKKGTGATQEGDRTAWPSGFLTRAPGDFSDQTHLRNTWNKSRNAVE